MFNKIVFLGRLTRDIEVREFPSGGKIATMGMASSHYRKNQDGSTTEEVCFVDVKIFGRIIESAQQFLHKGSRALVEGRLAYESWTDQAGNKRSKHVIIADTLKFIDYKQDNADSGYSNYGSNDNYGNSGGHGNNNQNNYNSYQPQNSQKTFGQQTYSPNEQQSAQNIPSIDVDNDEIPF